MLKLGVPERAVFWRELIGQQAESGVTVDEFCRRQQVSSSSFYEWRRRLAGAAQPTTLPKRLAKSAPLAEPAPLAKQATPRFLPVRVAEVLTGDDQPSLPQPAVELERADGTRIRVFDGARRETICDVLAALDQARSLDGDCG